MAFRKILTVRLARAPAVFSTRGFAQAAATSSTSSADKMFCFQCEQTENGTGCTTVGVCGKTPDVASLQDLLIYSLKGVSMWESRARQLGAPADHALDVFTINSLFSTLTNVNFDNTRFRNEYLPTAMQYRERAKAAYLKACKAKGVQPEALNGTAATWTPTVADLAEEGRHFGVKERQEKLGREVSGMQELITYGLKGTAAYASHAKLLGKHDDKIFSDMHDALSFLGTKELAEDSGKLLTTALKVGEINLRVLGLLEDAHITRFGDPTPTVVKSTPKPGKCILVSGHDMTDLEEILKETEGKGINVYTHGELLPAHGYPGLHKYKHLAGNFGGPWQLQKFEFAKFPGPIVMTTNCLVEPRKSYKDRIYTTNEVGWEGISHIKADASGKKDYSAVVRQALTSPGFTEADTRLALPDMTTGFGYNAVMSVAGKVIKGVEDGHITRLFFIGGCDGSEGERNYYTDLAKSTPASSLILTAGCGKYRFNKLNFGTVPNVGLPRVIDFGQCNDSYAAVKVALALAKHFKTDVNGLPLSFAVSWFEQKAVAILLTLLHLGVKNVAIGPNMPAFVGPETGAFLSKQLGLRRVDTEHVDADLKRFLGGNV